MTISPRSPQELFFEVSSLARLPADSLGALAERAELRKASKGTALFHEDGAAEGLFVIRTGEVKVVKGAKDGREQILYLARPGRPVVDGIRFDGGVYPASALCMRDVSAYLVPNAALGSLGEHHPQLMCALLDLRARRHDRILHLIGDLSLRTVPARLASFLCTLVAQRQARGDDAIHLVRDLTTETVAGRLGTVREEISRGLALLEREGALKVSPDMIEVDDLARLEAIAYGSRRS